jgi:phenylalanyl-tRNA synthetase beta chain
MKFTLSWLKTHLQTDATLDQITKGLTAIGLEVEEVVDRSKELSPFVVGYVVEAKQHPNADRLRVCQVDAGKGIVQVVCGAPNARTGMKGVFAAAGTVIPRGEMLLKAGNIRGEASNGMLCSASEMLISDDHDGIIELPEDAVIGAPFAEAMGLNDPLIEIAVTPNHAEALGVRGIARDLAAAGLGVLIERKIVPIPGKFPSSIKVHLEAGGDCPMFVGRLIKGVRNGPSPPWLRRRLESIGLRPISTLVDLTNFMTFDVNRPLHVFDAAKLKGDLRVHPASGGETMAGLNGKDYVLEAGMTAISDENSVVSLGGVMGGAGTGVSEETTEVFVEAALFDTRRVAATGRKLSLSTDARFRFERGIDLGAVVEGMEAVTALILETCGGEPSELVIAGAPPSWERQIAFRPERVKSLVGFEASPEECRRILTALGFSVGADWMVTPPSWRGDIEGEADLVEEVARIIGFDSIPAVLPDRESAMPPIAVTPSQRRIGFLRRALAARGLNEAVTWSFLPKAQADRFGGGAESLKLVNPISADLDWMRPSLLPNLLAAAQRNHDRGVDSVDLFELGPAYHSIAPDGQEIIAAGLRSGPRERSWRGAAEAADFHAAKADVWAVLAQLGVDVDRLGLTRDAPDYYHPGRSAVARLGPKAVLARFGEPHPEILKEFDLTGPVAMLELFLDAIPLPKAKTRAKPLLKPNPLQPVERDFAFLVPSDTLADALVKAARGADKALIVKVSVFDVYAGKGMAQGQKSIAIAVTLQPVEKTLTDAEIDAVGAKIVAAVTQATGGSLRG